MIPIRTLLSASVVLVGATIALAQCCTPAKSPQVSQPEANALVQKGVQKATIVVDNAFAPNVIKVKSGRPVELTFDTKSRGCATSVTFQGLNLKKDLTNGKKTIISFTPKKAGKYVFACPMNMIKGTLVVE